MVTLNCIIEALLFSASGPLTEQQIEQAIRGAAECAENPPVSTVNEDTVGQALQGLAEQYEKDGHAFQLVQRAGGWQLTSRAEYAVWIRQLYPDLRPNRLSPPALETLAIIAYRQPITKADIEAIRGVSVDGVLQKLLDAGLSKIAGRAEIPGRPLLYETTHHFLEHFGLNSLQDLPNAHELRQISELVAKTAGTVNAGAKHNTPELIQSQPAARTTVDPAGLSGHSSEEESGASKNILDGDPQTD